MSELEGYSRIVLAALSASQVLLLALRAPACRNRGELAWYLTLLALIGLADFIPGRDPFPQLFALAVLWAAGMHAASQLAQPRLLPWTASALGCALLLALTAALGFRGTLPYLILSFFACQLLSLYPLILLARSYRERFGRRGSQLASLLALAALFLAQNIDLLSRAGLLPELRLALWASLAFLLVSGYRLAQEGYLLGSGWQGLSRTLSERERLLAAARSRLLETEDTLRLIDRLAATGMLAAGAAHEFKNVLAYIQAAAEFGLDRRDADSMTQALKLVLEQTEQGRRTATDLLDEVIQAGEEKPRQLRLPRDIEPVLRLARTACRRQEIRLLVEGGPEVSAIARKAELEQVLLSLIRNAADSIRAHRRPGEGLIRVRCRGPAADTNTAVLEVEDNGGGVNPELGSRIFELSVSDKGSSGLGLYLARKLAERAGGGLDYVPCAAGQGSCFRLYLPVTE